MYMNKKLRGISVQINQPATPPYNGEIRCQDRPVLLRLLHVKILHRVSKTLIRGNRPHYQD